MERPGEEAGPSFPEHASGQFLISILLDLLAGSLVIGQPDEPIFERIFLAGGNKLQRAFEEIAERDLVRYDDSKMSFAQLVVRFCQNGKIFNIVCQDGHLISRGIGQLFLVALPGSACFKGMGRCEPSKAEHLRQQDSHVLVEIQ